MENVNNCPTIATTSYNMSDKYKFQSTKQIISFFESQGFSLASKKVCRVRKQSKQGFQKHMLRFDHEALKIDDQNRLQVLVKNSHDGSSSLQINLGIYRLVCSNGLVIGEEFMGYNLRHTGHQFYIKLEQSLKELIVAAPKYKELIIKMKNTKINDKDKHNFIIESINMRLIDINNITEINIDSFQPIRLEDDKNDIYTVFNMIQERIIKGGVKYITKQTKLDENNNNIIEFKQHTTKKINSIDKDIELNKFLFDKAMSYLKIA